MPCEIFYGTNQLCFTAVPFPESMLKRNKDMITLNMVHDLLVNNVLENFARDIC